MAKSPSRAVKRRKAGTVRRRGISRIDQESTRTHGWFVRVGYYETKQGTYRAKHTRFFGDVTNGGKTKGLKAAEVYVAKVSKPAPKAKAKKKK